MTTRIQIIRPLVVALLVLANLVSSTFAQEVPIPDPGLNAALREALQKPAGPLTEQDMLSLTVLSACCRGISSIQGLEGARNLTILDLHSNSLTNCVVPNSLTNLHIIDLFQNQLTSFAVPAALSNLTIVDVAFNSLSQCSLPNGLTNLDTLFLEGNQLTNFTLPAGLSRLTQLDLSRNQLTNLMLPEGLTHLVQIDVLSNQLASLTLPPDMTQLVTLVLEGNPLTTLVLSEPLAATNLTGTVSTLTNQGVNVFTHPLVAQLVRPLALIGAFQFAITGPPGVYSVFGSTNVTTWSAVGVATNPLGSVNFHDVTADASAQKVYRVLPQVPPANMVFIPPNTFTMGTPSNEANRATDEGPQTTATITHGFWIGKYEVTQREYLAVIGANPSGFPGDLDRPVETVSWLDATNYCAKLTEQELAAGRISLESLYRLPTEAEWECAARAGTSTRFSYGDDPNFEELANHAWYWFNSDVATHPVGQKAPNPWGLYDMEGNVWEWTQDWYGPYPGGSITDPQGPASNSTGVKVIRGGAWDAGEANCRSGRRQTEGVHPFITDYILGFRVVLVTES